MDRSIVVAAGLMVCLTVSPPLWAADWYPGIVHAHTCYSDGQCTPGQLATKVEGQGCRFIVFTDHYDLIPLSVKKRTALSFVLSSLAGPNFWDELRPRWGFEEYSSEVLGLTRDGEFVAIPGAEIGARWETEPGNEASAHTLALGVIREADSQVLDEYCEKLGHQQDVINKIRQWDMLPVAAHPSFLHDGRSGRLSYTGRVDYRYDKRPPDQVAEVQYRGLAGVEMWNVDASDQYQTDIDFYMRLVREGYRPFITAGCDYHGFLAKEEPWLQRRTWVHAESLTTDGILAAIREGRTYAADHGAELVSISPMPGEHVTVDRPVIKAKVRFPSPTGSPKEFMAYRDGELVASSRSKQPAGRMEYDYEWVDADADPGEHSYVLRVSEVLITSPSRVASPPKSSAVKLVAVDRGGMATTFGWDAGRPTPVGSQRIGKARSLSLSPDGLSFCWAGTAGAGEDNIHVATLEPDASVRLLTRDGSWAIPSWDSEGSRILCAQQDPTQYGILGIFALDPSDGNRAELHGEAEGAGMTDIWAAPDHRLAAVLAARHYVHAGVVDLDRPGLGCFGLACGGDCSCDWLPDGTGLFVATDGVKFEDQPRRVPCGLWVYGVDELREALSSDAESDLSRPPTMFADREVDYVRASSPGRCFVWLAEEGGGGRLHTCLLSERSSAPHSPVLDAVLTHEYGSRRLWCSSDGDAALAATEAGDLMYWRLGMEDWERLASGIVDFSAIEMPAPM